MQQIHLQTQSHQTLTQVAGDVWASFSLSGTWHGAPFCTLPASVHMHFCIILDLNMRLNMFNYSWSERLGLGERKKKRKSLITLTFTICLIYQKLWRQCQRGSLYCKHRLTQLSQNTHCLLNKFSVRKVQMSLCSSPDSINCLVCIPAFRLWARVCLSVCVYQHLCFYGSCYACDTFLFMMYL